MFCIGESLNVMSKKIGTAFKERNPKPIQEEALFQKSKGMDYIDINLGPAKKDGVELMPWVVQTVQEVVDDVPLALDTSNVDAIAAALKVCKLPPLINSIMCRPERYQKMIPIAAQYNADFIALMWGPEGLPRDENERAALCVELLYAANEAGIPNEKIFTAPIVNYVNHVVRRIDYTVGIRYSDDADRAIAVINRVIDEYPFALKYPEPVVFVETLGDNSVNIAVRIWAPVGEWYGAKKELLWRIKTELEREGMEIPFPQQVVWFGNELRTAPAAKGS